MNGRKLDVSRDTGHPEVKNKRALFDRHIANCDDCQPSFCIRANVLWRDVCLTALRMAPKGGA